MLQMNLGITENEYFLLFYTYVKRGLKFPRLNLKSDNQYSVHP